MTTAALLANTRANTHTNPKRHNDEPHPTSILLGLHYSQCANQMLVLIWAPSLKFYYYHLNRVHTLFNSVICPPKNQSINCINAFYKFGYLGYRHRSQVSKLHASRKIAIPKRKLKKYTSKCYMLIDKSLYIKLCSPLQ